MKFVPAPFLFHSRNKKSLQKTLLKFWIKQKNGKVCSFSFSAFECLSSFVTLTRESNSWIVDFVSMTVGLFLLLPSWTQKAWAGNSFKRTCSGKVWTLFRTACWWLLQSDLPMYLPLEWASVEPWKWQNLVRKVRLQKEEGLGVKLHVENS